MMSSKTTYDLVTAFHEHLIWIIFLAVAIALRAVHGLPGG